MPDSATIACLVNCAAIFDHQPAATMTLDAWERVLKVNLTGPFLCSQAAFPRMRSGSIIVNIGSINGHRAIPTHANYAVSKAGLMMLTRCLAVEWARHGIRVISVSPGIVDTAMNRRVEEQAGSIQQRCRPNSRSGVMPRQGKSHKSWRFSPATRLAT